MDDCYLKEFEATVESTKDGKYVVLSQTAFYPVSGGVANDTGVLAKGDEEFPVVYVGKFDDAISHEVSKPGLKPGDKVTGKIGEYMQLANKLVQTDAPVKVSYMKREDALKIPDMVKLANKMPPNVGTLRIVEIEGIDRQADGGCHVKSLKEIGKIELLKVENKGKDNRRLYYMVSD